MWCSDHAPTIPGVATGTAADDGIAGRVMDRVAGRRHSLVALVVSWSRGPARVAAPNAPVSGAMTATAGGSGAERHLCAGEWPMRRTR